MGICMACGGSGVKNGKVCDSCKGTGNGMTRPSLAALARRIRPLPVELRKLVAAFYSPEPARGAR